MPSIHLTIGLPASGKTTWVKDQVKNSKGKAVHTSRDDIRKMLFGYDSLKNYRYSNDRENLVTQVQEAIIQTALEAGKDIYVGDTNLNAKRREQFDKIAQSIDMPSLDDGLVNVVQHTQFLNVHPEVCKDRDTRRRESVGGHIIDAMVAKEPDLFEEVLKTEPEYDWVYQMDHDFSKDLPNAILIDLDGTIAKMNGRGPYDYDKVETDLCHDDVWAVISGLNNWMLDHGIDARLIFVSGRKASCYDQTRNWLNDEFDVADCPLFMRKADDDRPDHIVKKEIFLEHIDPNYHVTAVFDDRDQVVNMWRQLGLRTYQVAHGHF